MYSSPMERLNQLFPSRTRILRINFLLAGIAELSLLAWIFNTIPPKEGSVILLTIILIWMILFCFLAAFIKNVRRCLLWSSGVGIFLILRAAKLHDPLYLILLIALLASLELALKNK